MGAGFMSQSHPKNCKSMVVHDVFFVTYFLMCQMQIVGKVKLFAILKVLNFWLHFAEGLMHLLRFHLVGWDLWQ